MNVFFFLQLCATLMFTTVIVGLLNTTVLTACFRCFKNNILIFTFKLLYAKTSLAII